MARRKKTSKRRGRRMGGVGGMKIDFTTIAGAVAGAVIAKVASKKIPGNDKVKAAGQIGAGVVIPMFIKNPFVKAMGTGMIINGSVSALESFGVISAISGMGEAVELEYDSMSGDDLSPVAGLNDSGIMSGEDRLAIVSAPMDDSDDYDY